MTPSQKRHRDVAKQIPDVRAPRQKALTHERCKAVYYPAMQNKKRVKLIQDRKRSIREATETKSRLETMWALF